MDIKLITIIVSVAILMIVLAIITVSDYMKNRHTPDYKDGAWLFTNFWTNSYSLFFKGDVISSAKKLGIHTDEYLSNCRVAGIKPNLKRYVMSYLGAIFLMFGGIILFAILFLLDIDILVSIVVLMGSIIFAAAIMETEKKRAANGAIKVKAQIVDEMPRFLDLVEAGLFIGLPIESALMMAAESIPGVIPNELIKIADETSNSEKSWQSSLHEMANKYNVEVLTNFVLDVTTSYKKGVNIYESVVRQNEHSKQAKMFDLEAKAAKIKSAVLLPVALFKLLPIMFLFIFPVLEMLKGF